MKMHENSLYSFSSSCRLNLYKNYHNSHCKGFGFQLWKSVNITKGFPPGCPKIKLWDNDYFEVDYSDLMQDIVCAELFLRHPLSLMIMKKWHTHITWCCFWKRRFHTYWNILLCLTFFEVSILPDWLGGQSLGGGIHVGGSKPVHQKHGRCSLQAVSFLYLKQS